MGNPVFKDKIRYAPEKVFEDKEVRNKIFDEVWTGGTCRQAVHHLDGNIKPTVWTEEVACRCNNCTHDNCIGQDSAIKF